MTEIVATDFGDPGVLAVVQAKQRSPGCNEVTVAVRAAGVNHRDYKSYADRSYATARGRRPTFPMQLGFEASGIVIAAGIDAAGPAGAIVAGDEVIAYRIIGAYAGTVVVQLGHVRREADRSTEVTSHYGRGGNRPGMWIYRLGSRRDRQRMPSRNLGFDPAEYRARFSVLPNRLEPARRFRNVLAHQPNTTIGVRWTNARPRRPKHSARLRA